jgi:putative protease
MENLKREIIADAKGSGHKVAISIATDFDLTFAIIMRYLDKGETTRQTFSQNQVDK